MAEYIDPNSGRAPQPGGFAAPALREQDEQTDVGAQVDEDLISERADYVSQEQAEEAQNQQLESDEDPEQQRNAPEDQAVQTEAAQFGDPNEDKGFEPSTDEQPGSLAVEPEEGQTQEGVTNATSDEAPAQAQISGDSDEGSDEDADESADGGGEDEGEGEQFDPADHTADEVRAYVDENPGEAQRLLDQEREGKNRSGLTKDLEARLG